MERLLESLREMKEKGLYRELRYLEAAQGPRTVMEGRDVLLLSSNNYLGLCSDERLKRAAVSAIEKYGVGSGGCRLITGSYDIHRELEERLARFKGTEACIVFNTGYMANLGTIASLTDRNWVIFSDSLNHASIVDGCRLSGARIVIYRHADADDLHRKVIEHKGRPGLIVTDGVFSMEGDLAPLDRLVEIARTYGALLFVDDSHAVGVCGKTGRGTPEAKGVHGKIDVLTGTLGKAIGGAAGGYISGKKELIAYMRQKARTYIFSNSLPPSIVYGAAAAFDLLMKDRSIVKRLHDNTAYFRKKIAALGFTILEGDHPIVPIMLGEAALAQQMSNELLKEGVYIKGLWFPVVPRGEARLRAQISAALTRKDIDRALLAFERVGRRLNVLH